jgi:hypothetical protein
MNSFLYCPPFPSAIFWAGGNCCTPHLIDQTDMLVLRYLLDQM